jgi:hypothetical protein
MNKKFSYATQRNIPCNQNAQRWYMINSIQKLKIAKNPVSKQYYYKIANYYLNGNAYVVL